ncbi:lipopolysaccharide transport periplasmic protein LptA [Orbaceae bacterium ESL0727]|nr:lipopolysaccharide transport periplasmic protein LptA [Orbaceae bacterium ESL0727]
MRAQKTITVSLFFLTLLSFGCLATEPTPTLISTSTPQATQTLIDNKPITIDADNQQIDIEKNTITFSGNVVIVQDGLTIKADKVVITDMQDNAKQKITAYGNPLNFNQVMKEKHKNISGRSDQLVYNVKQNLVILSGHAEIIQQDNHISSQTITYNVDKQQILADPGKSGRVKTTIVPSQVKRDK